MKEQIKEQLINIIKESPKSPADVLRQCDNVTNEARRELLYMWSDGTLEMKPDGKFHIKNET